MRLAIQLKRKVNTALTTADRGRAPTAQFVVSCLPFGQEQALLSVMRLFSLALLAALALSTPAIAQDHQLERAWVNDLQTICDADRGRLWGVSLCGPVIIVDPSTRAAFASQPDFGGVLRQSAGAWTGTLPQGAPVANSTVEWSGVRWIMLIGPPPADATERQVLIAHEAWHRIQEQLGLPAVASSCAHLETERGRYLMRLELRALATAMRSRGAARRRAAEDALAFRAVRLAEFAGAAGDEAALDRNEGLAAYTGVKLGAAEPDFYAARTLDNFDNNDAYPRSYAYASGPAYGLLLDTFLEGWRSSINLYTPADVLTATLNVSPPSARQLRRSAETYGGPAIAAEEQTRAIAREQRVAELRRTFGGARLELPLTNMQFEFDPMQVTVIDGLGSIYAQATVRDAWGEVIATQGALIASDFGRLIVLAPAADGLTGPGWALRLNPGFGVGAPDAQGVRQITAIPLAQ